VLAGRRETHDSAAVDLVGLVDRAAVGGCLGKMIGVAGEVAPGGDTVPVVKPGYLTGEIGRAHV